MKHFSDFQKCFSETKYLKQSKSNLIFTKMQKRWFDARGALSGSFDYEKGLVLAGLHWNWIEYAYTRNSIYYSFFLGGVSQKIAFEGVQDSLKG